MLRVPSQFEANDINIQFKNLIILLVFVIKTLILAVIGILSYCMGSK